MSAARWLGPLFLSSAGACGDRSLFADQEREAGVLATPDASARDTGLDVQLNDSAGFQDALPDATGDACTDEPGPGRFAHLCVPPTRNECDGVSNPNRFLPNGSAGNAFDDDCDGLVDEGCSCGPDFEVGETRVCWLVPSIQVSLDTRLPAGWCLENSHGLVECVFQGSGDATRAVWSGECEGARQPFPDDVCAPGDFDCDGKEANPRRGNCACSP